MFKKQPGFTIIELVIVIVLVGIMSAFIFPRLGIDELKQQGFAQEVLSALRFANKTALTSGCEVQVTLTSSSYALNFTGNAADPCSSGAVTNPFKGGAYTGTAPAGVSLSGSTFNYDPFGRASSAQIINVAGTSIRVIAETGFTYVP